MADFKFACPGCGKMVEGESTLAGTEVVCPFCGRQFKAPALLRPAATAPGDPPPPPQAAPAATSAAEKVKTFSEKFIGKVTSLAGEDKIEGFSAKQLFSQVFARHSSDEIEEFFTVGTAHTTPPIEAVDPSWPHPWLFFRMFAGALAVYAALVMAWNQYGNSNLLPAMMFVGSFAVPMSMIVFFIEMNARRNVSLYQVFRMVFAGGVLGLLLTLVLYSITDAMGSLAWLGNTIAGPVEETGKLVALILVINSMKRRYILNGLLFGAAIGAGFAAFESAGYAMRNCIPANNDFQGTLFQAAANMQSNIMLRGVLSPFGHIVWTGMSAAALWKVMGMRKFDFAMLKDPRFLRIFAIAIGCHMIWDWSFDLPFYAKYAVLGIVAWIVIFAQIQGGLKQLRDEKAAAPVAAQPAAQPPATPGQGA